MNLSSRRSRQKGAFAVEMALVASVMVFVLAFTTDVVLNQSLKGKLDRMSYSMVNILKERTQLYNAGDVLDSDQVDELYDVLLQSLGRTVGGFDATQLGMYVEQQKFTEDDDPIEPQVGVHLFSRGTLACQPAVSLRQRESLSVVTTFDRRATLYMVTICYQGKNWFGELMDENYGLVRSYSIMIGR
ncbi:tight adherence pilus pseudopilin TadF [Thaumasiovibrio subtropicus]|uniref:tight adherence pilus pseudopilin TadF n=1 Tax=Thaumasiovibrio subtropicus TaxID=1891207 RepID=UPI00131B5A84|nr:tight adherence pilus pseudopilin TadF [Thaumasiovibrio subtropicus]